MSNPLNLGQMFEVTKLQAENQELRWILRELENAYFNEQIYTRYTELRERIEPYVQS